MNTYSMTQSTPEAVSPRPHRTSTLAALTVAGLALAMAGPAAALPCDNPSARPNASRVLGVNTHKVSSKSPDTGYATVAPCPYWVVDISVPSNSSGTGGDDKSFTILTNPIPLNDEGVCTAFQERTYVYKYGVIDIKGTKGFYQIGSWKREGVWDPNSDSLFPPCKIKSSGLPTLSPPASGKDLYRVVSQRKDKMSGKWMPVYVEAIHETIPK
jgi:hypothetical protein